MRFYAQDIRHRSLFERQPEATLANLGPWLLQLPEHAHNQVDGWLRSLELDKPVVAWLSSEADFEAMFEHLECCLDLRRPSGKLALLRYWDGAVFLRLQRVLTLSQRRQLLGPIAHWSFRILGETYTISRSELQDREVL